MRTLFLYLHTHWDREWYQPFESFRTTLVTVIRQILDGLESGDLPSFYLDGQACVLEDAVALDPSLSPRIKAAMATGALNAGPWYVLADQMLVGGESLIRNLATGLAATRRFGDPEMVGYCPDTFGHSQDLPRILSGFGIDNAVVWRGVPSLGFGTTFFWNSPDGSRVLAYHLGRGYYQTHFHEAGDGGELAQALLPWLESGGEAGLAETYYKFIDGALYPAGGDHLGPPRRFGDLFSGAAGRAASLGEKAYALEVVSLSEFLARVGRAIESGITPVREITGELRDNREARPHGRAYLLPGVLSTRLYLKRENRLAEHRLFRMAEPLFSLLSLVGVIPYPQPELEHALRLLLLNQPHDSICGCSVDEVHQEMMLRSRRLHQVLDSLESRAVSCLAPESGAAGAASAYPSPRDPGFGADRLRVLNLSQQAVSAPLRLTWARQADGPVVRGPSVQIISRRRREELFAGEGMVPYYKDVELVDGWVWAQDVPPFGQADFPWPPSGSMAAGPPRVTVGRSVIDNGLLKVVVDTAGGLAVFELSRGRPGRSFVLGHHLEDVGDGGDSYNFDPLPADMPIRASLRSTRLAHRGPLVGSMLLTYDMKIPDSTVERPLTAAAAASGLPSLSRSPRLVVHRFTTEVSLKRGLPIVFFETRWQNRASGHRLEVLMDTGLPVRRTFSENHFSLVERPHPVAVGSLPVEPGEEALPDRFPCQRFFVANGQVFLNQGLPEYAVQGSHVSMTLLRSVSLLSRGRMRSRGGGAGPHLDTPGAAMLGRVTATYGWAPLPEAGRSPHGELAEGDEAAAYRLAELFEGCLWAAPVKRKGEPERQSFLRVDNPALQVRALFRDGETLAVRLLNVTNSPQQARIETSFLLWRALACRLDGAETGQLALETDVGAGHSSVLVAAGPAELLTVRLLPARDDR